MFLLRLVWAVVHALFAKKADLLAENLALRQRLIVFRRKVGRPRLRKGGRPAIDPEIRDLIRRMSRTNPLWGVPRQSPQEPGLHAPRSPWQDPYVERVIGSVRRECLDKDAPDSRSVEPPTRGKVVAFPEVSGLHHRYTRRAA